MKRQDGRIRLMTMTTAARLLALGLTALALSTAHPGATHAQAAPPHSAEQTTSAVADFYRNRTINLVVGYTVGGGFDLYARLLARHIGRFVPGHPTVLTQNMPGAASLKAMEYLLAVAPRDGTVIATFSHTMPIAPLLGRARFDARQIVWIGSMASETSVCLARAQSPVKTWSDLARTAFTVGGTGKGSDPDMLASLLRSMFGFPVKLVSGYPGTAEIILAADRGEVDGICGLSWSTLTSRHGDWLTGRKVNLLLQASIHKSPQLPDVPLLLDMARSPRERQIITLLVAPQAMARPFAMPPGTPPARAEAIRAAFVAALNDPALLADAQQARIDIGPMAAAEMEQLIGRLYDTPADVVREAVSAFGE